MEDANRRGRSISQIDQRREDELAIIGHGIDTEPLEGFDSFATDDDWLRRVFSDGELSALPTGPKRISTICGHYCLKEAVLKALGVGFSEGLWLPNVIVSNNKAGQPTITLLHETAQLAESMGITAWHVSISHSESNAVASAIAEQF